MKRKLASLEQRIEALEQESHKERVPIGLGEFNAACERIRLGSLEVIPGLAYFYGEDEPAWRSSHSH